MKNLLLVLPRLVRMIASPLADREVPVTAKVVLAAVAVYLASRACGSGGNPARGARPGGQEERAHGGGARGRAFEYQRILAMVPGHPEALRGLGR